MCPVRVTVDLGVLTVFPLLQVSSAMKGFTSSASAVVSFSLFIASARIFEVKSIDLMANPQVLPGLLLGTVMPFIFSALTMMTLGTVR